MVGRRSASITRCRVGVDPSGRGRIHADDFIVDLDVTADFARGRLVARSFRRMSHVELVRTADGLEARLHGVRHRLPVSTPVPLPVALAIAAGGVATYLRDTTAQSTEETH